MQMLLLQLLMLQQQEMSDRQPQIAPVSVPASEI